MTWAVVGLTVLAVLAWPSRRAGRAAVRTRPPAAPPQAATVEEAAAALALVAAALRGGLGSLEALEAASRVARGAAGRELGIVAAAHRWGEPPDRAWGHVGPGWAAAAVAWHAAEVSGAAPAGLLESAAERMRAAESRRVEAAVQRAGVLLVLPLGLCFLPGFVATTVAPVVLHLLDRVAAP